MIGLRQVLYPVLFSLVSSSAFAQAVESPAGPYGMPIHDNEIYVHGVLEQFELRAGAGKSDLRWSGYAWAGTDRDRLWLKSEGIYHSDGSLDDGKQEILYDRPISTYFDVQAGLRFDADSGPGRTWAAFGVQGLAPNFFELSGTAYVSDQGRFAANVETSYDLLLTQRLVLQPQLEINLYSKSDPARRVGSGFSDVDAGLRLRYEFSRKFAPYIGVAYERKFGPTADFARADGEKAENVRASFGIRMWF